MAIPIRRPDPPSTNLTVDEMVKEIKDKVSELNVLVAQANVLGLEVLYDTADMRHYNGNIPVITVHIKKEL